MCLRVGKQIKQPEQFDEEYIIRCYPTVMLLYYVPATG